MAARHAASEPTPDPEPAGPPPTDEEALANVLEGFPGATIQETVHRNG